MDKLDDARLYICDPSKNVRCTKESCHLNGGDCRETIHEKFKKEDRSVIDMAYEERIKQIAQDVEGEFAYDGDVFPNLVVGIMLSRLEDAEDLRKAYEKQIPKKPLPEKDFTNYSWQRKCPVCGDWLILSVGGKMGHCCNCGQAIDWSEEVRE